MYILNAILSRVLAMLVTVFGAAVVVFVIVRVVPGNPIAMMLPPNATEADVERLTQLYGLDRSIPEQFLIWVQRALEGDFGVSISLRQPVAELILDRLPATLELAFFALLIASITGVLSALAGTRFRGRRTEALVDVGSGLSLSLPDFLWGLILILLFGVLWPVFHISGRVSPALDIPFTTNFIAVEALIRLRFDILSDTLAHMLLPAIALALPLAAMLAQLLKQSLKEAMRQDYVMLSRTKGYGENSVILRDALPNAILPTMTFISVQFTHVLGGTVIVERLFSYEGLGNMAIDAVINRDLPLIQGTVILFALLFVMINLAVDFLYVLVNPRLRHA